MTSYVTLGLLAMLLVAGVMLVRHVRNDIGQQHAEIARCLIAANRYLEAARLDLERAERGCAEARRLTDRVLCRRNKTSIQRHDKETLRWN